MIRLSGARCLAMSVVGALFGWWATIDDWIDERQAEAGLTAPR